MAQISAMGTASRLGVVLRVILQLESLLAEPARCRTLAAEDAVLALEGRCSVKIPQNGSFRTTPKALKGCGGTYGSYGVTGPTWLPVREDGMRLAGLGRNRL